MARRYSLCLALLALAVPGSAHASTASISGNTLTITSGAEDSDIGVYNDCNDFNSPPCTGNLSITDSAGITPGAGCSARSATEVLCPGSGISLTQVNLGGGDDKFSDYVGLGDTVSGGAGNDAVVGGSGRDELNGNEGNDTLEDYSDDAAAGDPAGVTADGGPGNDELGGSKAGDFLTGGAGNDEITGFLGDDEIEGGDGDDVLDSVGTGEGNSGADDLSGGEGFDEVGYSNRSDSVNVTLDNDANDGIVGEGDNVRADVDRVIGGLGADTLTGTDGPETFDANDGDDTVEARGGDDTVNGSSGDDTLEGGDGDDTMDGGRANDLITGGAGRDNIIDDARVTSLGGDTIRVRDGERDQVTCYGGGDIVQADQLDVVDSLCEEIDRQTVSGGGGGGGLFSGLVKSIGISKFLRRGLRFTANIPKAGRYSVVLVISARTARKYGFGRGQTVLGGFRQQLDAGAYEMRIDELAAFRKKLRKLRGRPGFESLPAFVAIVRGGDTVGARKVRLKR